MPAYLAHYACGVRAWHTLQDGTLRQLIRRHPAVYDLGLAGPDLFFYSLGDRALGAEVGAQMHKERTGAFLRALYLYAMGQEGERRSITLAYLAGFLGHYSLDTCCHPLVFYACSTGAVDTWQGRHFRLEAEMDARVCARILGRDINESHQMGLLRLNSREIRAVGDALSLCIGTVYPNAQGVPGKRRMRLILREYYLLTGVLIDPTGMKEWLLYELEKRLLGHASMSPLFINRNRYHVSEELTEAFFRLFEKGVKRDAYLLKKLAECVEMVTAPEDSMQALFTAIGNRSYHFGTNMQP